MDQTDRRFITDMLGILVIFIVGVLAYWVYGASGVLLAVGLALTVWVAADIVLFRKG